MCAAHLGNGISNLGLQPNIDSTISYRFIKWICTQILIMYCYLCMQFGFINHLKRLQSKIVDTQNNIVVNAYILYYIAESYKTHNLKAMRKYYKLAFKNGHILSAYKLARNYYDIKQYHTAIKYYKFYIDNTNQQKLSCHSDVYDELGNIYIQINDYTNALIYLNKAIAMDPCYDESMCAIANYYYTIADYENMVKYYTMAAKLMNEHAILQLAKYYQVTGDTNLKIKYYGWCYNLNTQRYDNY